MFHDNLYGCDFSIWPEYFLQGEWAYKMKGVEVIFPFHGLFLILTATYIGNLIWKVTSMKLNFYGDPYNRILSIIENKPDKLEELRSLRSSQIDILSSQGHAKNKHTMPFESQNFDSGAETDGS